MRHNKKTGMVFVKQFKLSKHMPWSPDQIYHLIMDIDSYPVIYPMIRVARTTRIKSGYRDVEMEFNMAAGAFIKDPALGARITASEPYQIRMTQTKGQLEVLNMDWQLQPASDGGTHLEFQMDYQTGLGLIADNLVFPVVKKMVGETLARFEQHAAVRLAQMVETDQAPVRQRGRGSRRPSPL